jgi:hypothetical protein
MFYLFTGLFAHRGRKRFIDPTMVVNVFALIFTIANLNTLKEKGTEAIFFDRLFYIYQTTYICSVFINPFQLGLIPPKIK